MENGPKNNGEERELIDITLILDDMWKGFKKFFLLCLAVIFLCTTAFFIRAHMSYVPSYEAYSSFVVEAKTPYNYGTSYNSTVAGQLSETFPYIVTSDALNEVVAESLGMDTVPASITADSMEGASVFTIRVRAREAQLAYDVLQAVIENYPKVAEYIIGDTELTMIDESGVPNQAVNPLNYMGEAKKGILVGVALVLMALFFYACAKKTVRRESDLSSRVSVDFLGGIPKVRFKKRRKKKSYLLLLDGQEKIPVLGESLRTIRTRVIKEAEASGMKKILITSAAAGEGKTTFAVNLAIALAKKRKKVILIDADFRNPSVAKAMGFDSVTKGIQEVLNIGEKQEMREKLKEVMLTYKDIGLQVLPGEKAVKNPSRILGDHALADLLDILSEEAEYIIVDTPPCGILSDASVLARKMDGVIMVVRQDYTRLDRVLTGMGNIADTGAKLLGYVLNGTEVGITGYGYGYGYNYGYGYGYGYGRKKKYGYDYGDTQSKGKE